MFSLYFRLKRDLSFDLRANAVGESVQLERAMGKYNKGDHVKIEIVDERSGALAEWMWMLVDTSDDERRLVFGRLDNEPIANSDVKLGQQLAVGYDKVRDHRRFDDSKTVH